MYEREEVRRIMLLNPTMTFEDLLCTTSMELVIDDELAELNDLFNSLKPKSYPPAVTIQTRYMNETRTNTVWTATYIDPDVEGTGEGTRRRVRHKGAE